MPSGFASLDTGVPDLSGYSSTEQKLQAMEDYLVQLLEQLRYTLHNLGVENFNEEGLRQITEPLDVKVSGIYADEWERGKVYYKGNIVRITNNAGGVKYYEWSSDTPSVAGTKPPDGDWVSVSAPTVQSVLNVGLSGISLSYDNTQVASDDHNAAYITLNKDGTTIGGGKVFIKDLDASTIITGTLDAGNIVLRESFTVQAKDGNVYQECGKIGGEYTGYNAGTVWMESHNGKSTVYVNDEELGMYSTLGTGSKGITITGNEVEIWCANRDNGTLKQGTLRVDNEGIYIKKTGGSWINLFDLV